MACRDVDLLWQEYFRDPSQFWDDENRKRGPRSRNFQHRHTRQPLSVDGRSNSPSVQEELGRRSPVTVTDGELSTVQQANRDSRARLLEVLKACGKQKDLRRGSRVHADILKTGLLEKDIYIGTALLSMYAKCGVLTKAQEVFDELPAPNVVSWNALIAGYSEHGRGDEALKCFVRMRAQGISPNAVTFICILKACGSIGATDKGEEIHAEVRRLGLMENHDVVLGTALVSMYAKCGALAKAQEVFNELPAPSVVSWNALIAGYVDHGHIDTALKCFGRMRDKGISPNAVTFICILKACGSIGATRKGEEIHAELCRLGLMRNHDIVLGTALVSMYAKCGALAKAQEVFDEIPAPDIVSWNALISGYVEHGHGDEALKCFGHMRDEGLSPDEVTFTCILKACGSIGAIEKGEEIHAEVQKLGLMKKHDIVLGNALVSMYAKCGALAKAQQVFDELPTRDVVSWTALMLGYAEHGHGDEAFKCFRHMRDKGLSPDAVTFICILQACSNIGATEKGEEIHAEVCRLGLMENHDIVLGTALVSMYAKCGALTKAQGVFDELPAPNIVSWNALIAGYTEHGYSDEALKCFGRMRDRGLSPDAVTFACILKACGSLGAIEKGKEIHAEVCRLRLMENHNIVLGNALVSMYAKCGAFTKAEEVFDKLPVWDVVSWNALIAGYAEHGHGDEALKCFGRMRHEGVTPNAVTYICVLKACSSIGATEKGEEIHDEVCRLGLIENHDLVLGNALVSMYAKCGALTKAQEVFDELPALNVVSWNALMAGYAELGNAERVINSFQKMLVEHVEPDGVTFIVLLTACNHAGLVEEGLMYLDTMSTVFCIISTVEHHICMVDLLSRAGQFDKATSILLKEPTLEMWMALLGACRKWLNVERGRWAFEHAIQVDEKCAAAYICMSNIYATAGMQEEAVKVEELRKRNGAWKIPGHCWWTDTGRNVHSFTMGDKSHPQSEHIYAKLKDIDKKLLAEGYSPRLHWMSQAISDDGKENELCGHSEKLAIACALINTPEGTPIRVTKNMRVCGDCHFSTSLISKMEKRIIQVKDANRIHIFEDGKCICEEYC